MPSGHHRDQEPFPCCSEPFPSGLGDPFGVPLPRTSGFAAGLPSACVAFSFGDPSGAPLS
jgi:hypothetical protein